METLPTPILYLNTQTSGGDEDIHILETLGYAVDSCSSLDEALTHAPHARAAVLAVEPGAGAQEAETGRAVAQTCELPLILLVADEAEAGLDAFESVAHVATLPRSAKPFFWKKAIQLALQRAGIRKKHLEEEARLRDALAGAGDGVWEWDIQTNRCFFSHEWKQMLGYADDELQNDLSEWESRVHPEDLPACSAAIERYMRGESDAYQNEHRLRCKDGSYLWILDRGKITKRDALGNALQLTGTHSNIHARKMAELELARSQTLFQTLYEQSPLGVLIFDRDGRLLQQNQASRDLLGVLDPSELDRFQLFESRAFSEAQKQAIRSGDVLHIEMPVDFEEIKSHKRYQTSRSGTICLYLILSAVKDGSGAVSGFMIKMEEITARKQAEAQLRRWENIFQYADWGVAVSSHDGKSIAALNPGYARMHGYTTEELTGALILNLFAPEVRKLAAEQIAMADERGSLSFESLRLHKDGSTFVVQINVNAIRDAAGHFLYRIVNVQDISARKEAELRLRHSEEKYHTMVATLSEGVALNEVIYNEQGEMVDYRITEVNPAFYHVMGLTPPVVGRLATQVHGVTTDYIRNFWHERRALMTTQYTEMDSPRTGKQLVVANSPIVNHHFVTSVIDITERKQVEAALHKSEQKYRNLFENSMDGILLTRPDGAITAANPAACRMLGKTEEEIVRGGRAGMVDLADPRLGPALDERARTGFFKGELTYLHSDGTPFPVELSSVIDHSDDGDVRSHIVFRDISERKQQEKALRESEEKYRSLFENMQEGFALQEVILDEQGRTVNFRILEANQAYETQTGIKREDLIGRTILETQPSADRRMIERYGRVAELGEPFTFEYYSKTFNRHLRVKAFSPGRGRFATIFEDVSSARQAEMALRESEQKFRILFENRIFGVTIFDPQTLRILEVNDALLAMYGYERDELLDRVSILDLSGDEPTSLGSIRQTALEGATYVAMRYHRRKDGSLFPVEVFAEPHIWQGKQVIFGVIHDVTQRQLAEDAIQKLLAEKDLLMREVHHRIKNNMATISSLLAIQAGQVEDSDAKTALQEAETRVRSMMAIYERLYRSGNYQQLNAREYFEKLVVEISQTWVSPDLRVYIEQDIEALELPIKLSFPIGIVMNECITNAYKHAFEGRSTGTIRIALKREADLLILSVADDGIGLPADIDPAASTSFGLVLLNAMVQQMEARLEIRRENGTEFLVKIPV